MAEDPHTTGDLNKNSLSFTEKEAQHENQNRLAQPQKYQIPIIKKKEKRLFTLKGIEVSIPDTEQKDLNTDLEIENLYELFLFFEILIPHYRLYAYPLKVILSEIRS